MRSARLGAAIVLSAIVAAVTFLLPSHPWDVAATMALQRWAAPAGDRPASIITFVDDAEVIIPAVAFAGLVFWWRHDHARGAGALQLAAALTAVSAVAFALKFVLPHPGPPGELHRAVVRYGVGVVQPFSFPSGHTTRMTYFAAAVLRRVPAAAAGAVLTMMAALVYLGDHWTSDVLGGLCLGWVCVELAVRLRGTGGAGR